MEVSEAKMDTLKKFQLEKSKAIMLFIQMIFTIISLATTIYLLVFVVSHNLGAWMIVSYVFIVISIIAIIIYSTYGYKKNDMTYKLSIIPFLVAVFINVILPGRSTLQIALLALLFASVSVFLSRQSDEKFTVLISYIMIVESLVFSIYSSITANTQFLGDVSENWPTYFAMYLSIFIPTIMSTTLALTYNVRSGRKNNQIKN